MPIYGYQCQNCEHTLDALQKIADEPLVDCPECGKPELKRQLSAPRFRLKGQGWYETDFKKDKQRNLADGKKDTAADSKPAAADKQSDSKPDSKSDSKPASKPAKPAKSSSDAAAS